MKCGPNDIFQTGQIKMKRTKLENEPNINWQTGKIENEKGPNLNTDQILFCKLVKLGAISVDKRLQTINPLVRLWVFDNLTKYKYK